MTKVYQHVKHGTLYEVIGIAVVQAAQPVRGGATVTVYRDLAKGNLWARPQSEFEDGRFVSLPGITARPEGVGK